MPSSIEYLGVLLDTGRHYFPLDWIYTYLLPHLYLLDYNYIHFRVSDDQNFILNLTIQHNQQPYYMGYNARYPTRVYSPDEIQTLVKYAKHTYNITIIPELNLPGHAGSFGYSLPQLIIQCPQFMS